MATRTSRAILAQLLRPEIEAATGPVLRRLLAEESEPRRPDPPSSEAADLAALLARHDDDGLLDEVGHSARSLHGEAASQDEAVLFAWLELEREPRARRLLLVRHHRRFRLSGLVHHLVAGSCRVAPEDPVEACHRAELALELVDRLSEPWLGPRHREDLRSGALRALAGARHLLGDLDGAGEALGRAWEANRLGTADLLERAHLLRLKARFVEARGDRQEAVRLLGLVRAIYQRLRERDHEARTLLEHAELVGHREPAFGAALLRDAADLLDEEREPRVALSVWHQLAWFTNDSGQPEEALCLLEAARPLLHAFLDSNVWLQRRWLEGRICRRLDELDRAEVHLTSVALAFEDLGIVGDHILSSLDVLELYAHAGRLVDLVVWHGRVRRRLAAWGLGDDLVAAWARAAELAGDPAALRDLACSFRERSLELPRRRGSDSRE